jgi:hypothetical protein
MRRILVKGKLYDISEHVYLGYIRNLVIGYYNLAELYHRSHISGFSDWKGIFQLPDVGQKELEKSIVDQIDDIELLGAYNSFKGQLQKMIEVGNSITDWLAGFVGLQSAHDKNIRSNLTRRLNHILKDGPDGEGTQGPVWVRHQEYQNLVERSENVLARMREIHQQINQKIQLLEKSLTDDSSDV